MNQLVQLQEQSVIVADTGDIESIKKYKPQDATTNPSLILKAASLDAYQPLLKSALEFAKQNVSQNQNVASVAADRLAVLIGKEITELVPGVVSTEIDARLSFNQQAMIDKAQQLIEWYEELGVNRDRILIKIAATWEGVQAARALELLNVHCNLTLLFNLTQARACADAGVFLISPFVGRISDWYKARGDDFKAENDPGVISVKNIFHYYKKHDVKTVVMAASFRSTAQILELTGCDRLTIAPALLEELAVNSDILSAHISKQENLDLADVNTGELSEAEFRWLMNQDEMASEKLADGIRRFAQDTEKLEQLIESNM